MPYSGDRPKEQAQQGTAVMVKSNYHPTMLLAEWSRTPFLLTEVCSGSSERLGGKRKRSEERKKKGKERNVKRRTSGF